MKRILLLSDTHSYIDDRILDYAKDADEVWHCGDFGNMNVIEELEKIKPIAFDQAQITDGSHLLVWAAWDGYSHNSISEVFEKTTIERGIPISTMDDYKARLWGMYEPLGNEWHATHAAKQAYISFGLAIAAAAEQKVDATPMEGFDMNALDELLELREKGLKSVVILPLGYREKGGDWLVNLKKYRTPKDEFIIEIK